MQPARRRWWCRVCLAGDRWQDAIAYVQRRDGVTDFAEACRLGASPSELGGRGRARSGLAAAVAAALGRRRASELDLPEEPEPSPAWQARALRFLQACEAALWSPVGARARTYLHRRGLRDQTLRTWRVGFQPAPRRYDLAERWGYRPATAPGGTPDGLPSDNYGCGRVPD